MSIINCQLSIIHSKMLYSALLLGLTGSLHCLGMCGPLILSLQFMGHQGLQKGLYAGVYHLGRILTYSLMGLVLGALGSVFFLMGFQNTFSIVLGSLILAGLFLPTLIGKVSFMQKHYMRFVSYLKSNFAPLFHQKSLGATFFSGILNGLLPCGMVSIALTGATASGQALTGSLFMLLFGLGTIPLLLLLSFSQHLLPLSFKKNIPRFIPVVTFVFAMMLIIRGMHICLPFIGGACCKG